MSSRRSGSNRIGVSTRRQTKTSRRSSRQTSPPGQRPTIDWKPVDIEPKRHQFFFNKPLAIKPEYLRPKICKAEKQMPQENKTEKTYVKNKTRWALAHAAALESKAAEDALKNPKDMRSSAIQEATVEATLPLNETSTSSQSTDEEPAAILDLSVDDRQRKAQATTDQRQDCTESENDSRPEAKRQLWQPHLADESSTTSEQAYESGNEREQRGAELPTMHQVHAAPQRYVQDQAEIELMQRREKEAEMVARMYGVPPNDYLRMCMYGNYNYF